MDDTALHLLRQALQAPDATFREGQWECIEHLMNGRRLLVVQRTGWGKSMVYFLATRLLRDRGRGCTLIISPLLALMRNQIDAAKCLGLRAETINCDTKDEWERIQKAVLGNEVDLLLISPERLANEKFRSDVLGPIAGSIGLFVVDEAHCISDWGHDFRPNYRRISRIIQFMPLNMPVLATTATANNRVVNDIREQLGDIHVIRGPLTRRSLMLQNISLPRYAQRLAWLRDVLPTLPGSGIIYTLTVRDAETVASWLAMHGFDVRAYHAGLSAEESVACEDALLRNDVKALVATVKLGMGFDKPDLGFVIHFQRPGSVVHYYQQVGRAGRAVESAYGILLGGEEDDRISEYFIRTAFAPVEHTTLILDVLNNADNGLTTAAIGKDVNLSWSQIEKVCIQLSMEEPAPILKLKRKWLRTPVEWRPDAERVAAITRLRHEEQAEMAAYLTADDCLMLRLARSLDDPHAGPCGRCRNCAGHPLLPDTVDAGAVGEADAFLRDRHIVIEPRRKWPTPAAFPCWGFTGNIPSELQASEGRALCLYGDSGWGSLVINGKYHTGRFDDALVDACVSMLRVMPPDLPPAWVACVPSRRHPELVPDFARRLAAALSIPFSPAIEKALDNQPQKTMQNSWMQANNLDGAFTIMLNRLLPGPVLLVDDMVDSRWTMTVLAARLRQGALHHSVDLPAVIPLALAVNSLSSS